MRGDARRVRRSRKKHYVLSILFRARRVGASLPRRSIATHAHALRQRRDPFPAP